MKPLRLGFIGLGHITTKAHLPALAPHVEAGAAVLQAFCDVDETALREQAAAYGVERVYADHHAMFEQEALDAVFVSIPPTLHTDAELIAAERGIALFVEKPPTLDLGQAIAVLPGPEAWGRARADEPAPRLPRQLPFRQRRGGAGDHLPLPDRHGGEQMGGKNICLF